MGAAPVLIMLAAIGVDYGWQPDGTTSTRGDNIEYIVQISPDQLQQLQSIGEITSSIDPAVQNRVSRIVVRVGTAKLPRDAGRIREVDSSSQPPNGRTVSASPIFGDQQDVPIPEITRAGERAFTAANRSNPGATADKLRENASASVMKPDPQGAGFPMPGSLQGGSPQAGFPQAGAPQFGTQSPLDQVRTRAAEIANSASGNPSSPSFSGGPSTDEVPPSARTTNGWPSFVGPPRPSDPQSLTNPLATNPPNPYSAGAGSTAIDSNRTYGTSPTFGALPTAANSATNRFNTAFPSASTQSSAGFADPRNTTQPPAVTGANGYTRDEFGNILNRDNQLVDNDGYLIDPNDAKFRGANGQLTDRYGHLYDSQGNLIDKYGTQIDKYGKPLSASGMLAGTQRTSPLDSRFASTAPVTSFPSTIDYNASPNYSSPNYSTPSYSSSNLASPQPTAAQLEAQREAQRAYALQQAERDYHAKTAQLASYEDNQRSSSDAGLANATRLTLEQERLVLANATKMKSFAAQPLFNIVLLISLVGNAYLIFETNNLRRKFRSMLSTFRSAKAAAQPVA